MHNFFFWGGGMEKSQFYCPKRMILMCAGIVFHDVVSEIDEPKLKLGTRWMKVC